MKSRSYRKNIFSNPKVQISIAIIAALLIIFPLALNAMNKATRVDSKAAEAISCATMKCDQYGRGCCSGYSCNKTTLSCVKLATPRPTSGLPCGSHPSGSYYCAGTGKCVKCSNGVIQSVSVTFCPTQCKMK